jgi:hypothetical protein
LVELFHEVSYFLTLFVFYHSVFMFFHSSLGQLPNSVGSALRFDHCSRGPCRLEQVLSQEVSVSKMWFIHIRPKFVCGYADSFFWILGTSSLSSTRLLTTPSTSLSSLLCTW